MWIGALGPIAVVKGGHAVAIEGIRQAAALAALVLFAGRSVSADQLVDALWPGQPPPTARRTLQSHLSRLRGALGSGVISRDASGYRLQHPLEIDVVEFEHLLGRATASEDPVAAVSWLDDARALWRGEPYGELADWPAAVAERARLHRLVDGIDEDRLERRLQFEDPAGLVSTASALVTEAPLRERRWGLLMRALYGAGRQAEALRAFQDARTHLIEAVGVEPGPDLLALERAVLDQDDALLAPRFRPRPSPSTLPSTPDVDRVARFFDHLRERDPLEGREEELSRCLGLWERARRLGRPAAVVIQGEPGIGKTRLAAELVARADADGAVLRLARCREGAGAPYAPLAEAFAGRSPELVAALEGMPEGPASPQQLELTRRRVAAAFGRAMGGPGRGAPTVLLLDDVQWADLPTVEALRWVVERDLSGPVLLVLTVRANELEGAAAGTLGSFLGHLPRLLDVLELSLTGVDRTAAGRIVAHRAAHAPSSAELDWFCAESGGSPLYLIELARHREGGPPGPSEPPRSIRDLVRRRVGSLAQPAQDLLLAGAVLGEEFDVRVAAAMVSRPVEEAVDAASDAVRAELLDQQSPTIYRFSHGVTRRAVEATSSSSRLLTLHWAAGLLLEGSALVRPEEVASHLLSGALVGDPVRAARVALAASSSARDQLDPGEALRLLVRAADVLSGSGPEGQPVLAEVWLVSAALTARQGAVDEAKGLAAKAGELARSSGDATLLARAAVGYAELVNAGEADERAAALCREALDALDGTDPGWATRVLAALANYHSVVLVDLSAARPLADRALATAPEGDDDGRAEALWAQACALLGSPEVAERDRIAEALVDGTRPGARRHAEAVRLAAHTRLELGDRTGYDRALEVLGRLAAVHDSWDAAVWSEVGRGQVALMEGRLADWHDVAGTLDELAGGSLYVWSLRTLQECFRLREASELGPLAPMLELLAGQIDLSVVRAMYVDALLQAGERDRAAAELDLILRDGEARLRPEQTYTSALTVLMDAALDLGSPDHLRALAERLRPYSGLLVVSTQGTVSLGAVDRHLATAALADGDLLGAERLLDAARRVEAQVGAALWECYTAVAAERLRVCRGETPDAAVLDPIRAWAAAHGLARLQAHVEALEAGGGFLA